MIRKRTIWFLHLEHKLIEIDWWTRLLVFILFFICCMTGCRKFSTIAHTHPHILFESFCVIIIIINQILCTKKIVWGSVYYRLNLCVLHIDLNCVLYIVMNRAFLFYSTLLYSVLNILFWKVLRKEWFFSFYSESGEKNCNFIINIIDYVDLSAFVVESQNRL